VSVTETSGAVCRWSVRYRAAPVGAELLLVPAISATPSAAAMLLVRAAALPDGEAMHTYTRTLGWLSERNCLPVARDTLRQATEVTGIDALHGLLGRTDRYWLSDCWIDVASDEVRPTEWRWSCRRLTYGVRTEIGALQIDDPVFTKRLTTEAAALPLGVWTIDQTPTQAAHRRLRQWALGERQSAESVVSAIRNARGLVRDLRKNEWDVTEIKSPEEATAPHVVAIARHLPTNAWYAAIPGGSVTLGVVEPGESEFPLVSAWVSPFLLALEPQPGALFTGSAAANLLDWPMREQTGRPSAARLPTESEWEWGMRCIYGATVLVQQDRQARLPEVQHLVGLADWEVTCTPGDLPP
jgi:hypothetical protein